MLTISDLIAVLALCATFSVLVTCMESMIPRHKNNRPGLVNCGGYFNQYIYQANRLSVALLLYYINI